MSENQGHIKNEYPEDALAVIGMSCRFPGAVEVHEFWNSIKEGVELVSDLTEEELREAGESEQIFKSEDYVARASFIENATSFDADFFGITPREAELMDPQQRIMLQCAWRALESAGYIPDAMECPVGVFAGSSISTYLTNHLFKHPASEQLLEDLRVRTGNDKDFIATRISYLLNLTGPAISMNTACSTSLVAIHEACKSLLLHECDMALAGGVSIKWPQKMGYRYQQGGIASPDGRCRPFDAAAAGTIGGNGAGVVVLKRLREAINDRDPIRAIVRGTAINNDGKNKVGYTAPSVKGQRDVIRQAMLSAGVDADSIGYIEAHGTGTQLGDPIEVEALRSAFGECRNQNYCALGSVKPNIGHLDAAAGIAGFIKTVLVLENGEIPPLTHFQSANTALELEHSPFFIPRKKQAWSSHADLKIRRAGVSSFGIGGTNVHIIMEEPPVRSLADKVPSDQSIFLFPFSGRHASNVRDTIGAVGNYLDRSDDVAELSSMSATLINGRKSFSSRACLAARSKKELKSQLANSQSIPVHRSPKDASIIFVFQGQNRFSTGTTRSLYDNEPIFREAMDQCMEYCAKYSDIDIYSELYGQTDGDHVIKDVRLLQPIKFSIEYALAKWLMHKNILPDAMIGHSLGEYTAACISGVIDLDTAMKIISQRGQIMSKAPAGGMTAVYTTAEKTAEIIERSSCGAEISAHNAIRQTVISGSEDQLVCVEKLLDNDGIEFKRLGARKAYHTSMMNPVRDDYQNVITQCAFHDPKIPFISNVSGTWAEPAQISDFDYWSDHMEQPVRFTDGIQTLAQSFKSPVFVEIGVGVPLTNLMRQTLDKQLDPTMSLFNPQPEEDDQFVLWKGLAELWSRGVQADWSKGMISRDIPRIHLPGYAFSREEHALELPQIFASSTNASHPEGLSFYTPGWSAAPLLKAEHDLPASPCLICGMDSKLVEEVAQYMSDQNIETITASQANSFSHSNGITHLDFTQKDHREQWADCIKEQKPASAIWITSASPEKKEDVMQAACLRHFHSFLLQHSTEDTAPLSLLILTFGAYHMPGRSSLCASAASAQVLATVVMQEEAPHLKTRFVDMDPAVAQQLERLAKTVWTEWSAGHTYAVAWNGHQRMKPNYQRIGTQGDLPEFPCLLRQQGNYIITGGLGNVGRIIGEFLAEHQARTIGILSRRSFPEKKQWNALLEQLQSAPDAVSVNGYGDKEKLKNTLEQLISLQESGVDVRVFSSDITKPESLNKALEHFEETCGSIHGIIHAAGITSGRSIASPYNEIGGDELTIQQQPKLRGARNLMESCKQTDPDFLLLISSNASELGGLGLGAYAAASRAMDQQALHHFDEASCPVITTNWDGWPQKEQQNSEPQESDLERFALTEKEAKQSLAFILNQTTLPQIIISKSDYQARADRWLYPFKADEKAAEKTVSTLGADEANRPDLSSAYAPPEYETEQKLVDIWQELLGVQPVGIYDNFFELRGDSLLVTQMLTKIKRQMGYKIPLKVLFTTLTIRGLYDWMQENLFEDATASDENEREEEMAWEEGEI